MTHIIQQNCASQEECLVKAKDPQYYADLCKKNIDLTIQDLAKIDGKDILLSNALHAIEEIDKVVSLLSARLREWYGWHWPELVNKKQSVESLVDAIRNKERSADSFGIGMNKEDLAAIQQLATTMSDLLATKNKEEEYVENIVKEIAPNTSTIVPPLVAAKLITLAGSLKRLATLPSSTIQLLGAEKALFRHMKTGAKSPKYGILYQHPLIQQAANKGKAARLIADNISLAARVDYFKGEFVGATLLEKIKKKLS